MPAIEMPKFSEEQMQALINTMIQKGITRARAQGKDFSKDYGTPLVGTGEIREERFL